MSGLRFYVLCCRNLKALKRHQKTIPVDQLTIVINTLDEQFKTDAVAYCQEQEIDYAVTESNGTPAQGKNSVMDLFQESDYDYFVLVDGDDFLTPHGVWTYQQLANSSNPPDVLALEYQYGLWVEYGYGGSIMGADGVPQLPQAKLGVLDDKNPNAILAYPTRVFMHERGWWQQALSGTLVPTNPADPFSYELCSVHTKWTNYCYDYISPWETHLRMVFFSRNAVARHYRYNPEYMCGEDTLLYLIYKDAWTKGDIKLRHLFDRYPTYVYDQRVGGVIDACKDFNAEGEWVGHDYGWYLWMKKLCDAYAELESQGKLHQVEVPKLNVRTYVWPNPDGPEEDMAQYDLIWPDDYRPDLLGLVNYPGNETVQFL